jgi:chemosensory pili system protein ChpA (sensor histidine kinase/response regulator)
MGSRLEAAKSAGEAFDPLEMDRFTRFQELTRMMAESVGDVATVQRGLQTHLQAAEDQIAGQARLTRELQEDLLRARIVPFDTLSDRLYRVLRQAAKETGKSVRLNLAGTETLIDRSVLDRLAPALEHLLRNAVVHGIEPASVRAAAGKDASGTVQIDVAQAANEVSVEVRDDGAGLNLPRILTQARAMGLLPADAAPTEAELAQLIFTPGFSTAEQVTELAGRGFGMDVVRAEVSAMGGRIETATAAGRGTAWRLLLPLTTAATQVVLVRCGGLTVAVPAVLARTLLRLPAAEVRQAYRAGQLAQAGQALPFFWFGGLFGAGPDFGPLGTLDGKALSVLLVQSASQTIALHVDEVLGHQEVVIKNLGPQLARLPGLVGLSMLPAGQLVMIYNPVALATVYGVAAQDRAAQAARGGAADVAAAPALQPAKAPLVLVVDDSLTVRRVTQRALERDGWRVALARDGVEALEQLALERPAVMLSDIEMPRMDGFDLVREVRADRRLQGLPVVMITSRLAAKHQDHARALGVNHYLGKPYDESALLALVRTLAQPAGAGP